MLRRSLLALAALTMDVTHAIPQRFSRFRHFILRWRQFDAKSRVRPVSARKEFAAVGRSRIRHHRILYLSGILQEYEISNFNRTCSLVPPRVLTSVSSV